MSHRLHVGYFEDEHAMLEAARECKERSIAVADVVSPYPIHGIDSVLGIRPSRLPWVTLTGGLVGASIGFGFQYWSSWASWPINVGGRPFNSLPAFIPVGFELTILIAGLSTVFMLLLRSGLRPGKQLPDGLDPTTDSRIALILEQGDASFEEATYIELLHRHGAVKVAQHSSEDAS